MRQIVPILMFVFLAGACAGNGEEVLLNGEACEADDNHCESGLCVEALGEVEVPGGFCTDECMWGENPGDPDTCAEGEICLRYNPTNEYLCYQRCSQQADCRGEEGWSCECLDFFCSVQACIPPL